MDVKKLRGLLEKMHDEAAVVVSGAEVIGVRDTRETVVTTAGETMPEQLFVELVLEDEDEDEYEDEDED